MADWEYHCRKVDKAVFYIKKNNYTTVTVMCSGAVPFVFCNFIKRLIFMII